MLNKESIANVLTSCGIEFDDARLELVTTAIRDRMLLDPIPMRIVCEGCGKLHEDVGEFASKVHHTHSCQHCGMTWRPAVVPTVSVRFLPGFKNADK